MVKESPTNIQIHIFFTHLSTSGPLGWFYSGAMDMNVQIFLLYANSESSAYTQDYICCSHILCSKKVNVVCACVCMICEGRECRPWHRFKGKRKTLVEHGFFFTPLGGSQGWNSGHQTHDNCWAILLDFMFSFCGISTLFPQYWYQVLFTLAIFENIFVFLMVVILSGLRWNLGVVLILISFTIKELRCFPYHVFIGYLYFFWELFF